jgi:hypothetical protein
MLAKGTTKAPPERGEVAMLLGRPGPGEVWGRDRHRDVTSGGFASATRGRKHIACPSARPVQRF